jgi:hypothetical protein
MRTYVRVTSGGSPYARFRRALDNGNLSVVRLAAAELPRVALEDALRVCLLIRDQYPDQYDRAALRWVGRFALEARSATLADVRAAADALARLPTDAEDAMASLERLCVAHRLV